MSQKSRKSNAFLQEMSRRSSYLASDPDSSARYFSRITADRMPASREVPARFSQILVSPSGQSATIRIRGKTSVVETEMTEAGTGFSMASM